MKRHRSMFPTEKPNKKMARYKLENILRGPKLIFFYVKIKSCCSVILGYYLLKLRETMMTI
jgi:hypothetical protein